MGLAPPGFGAPPELGTGVHWLGNPGGHGGSPMTAHGDGVQKPYVGTSNCTVAVD